MRSKKQKDLQLRFPGDLTEVERQIELWRSKATELWPNIMAFASALSADASQIVFKGDLIVFNAPAQVASDCGLPTLDLAAIRRIVSNLKILRAQREQLEPGKSVPITIDAKCSSFRDRTSRDRTSR